MSPKKSKAAPNERTIREDRKNAHHSLLIVAKDATFIALSAFPVSMIDNIAPFLPSHDLFIFMTTIKICQKSLMHELVMKAIIDCFRQITTEHAHYVTTINPLNTVSYLCYHQNNSCYISSDTLSI